MTSRREIDLTDSSPARVGVVLAAPPLELVPSGDWRARAQRAAAAELASRGASVDPDRVVLAAGRAQAYALVFSALGSAHDEILAPAPYDPGAARVARMLGLHVAHTPAGPDLAPDLGALHDAIGERTRAILIGTPAPASGAMATADHVEALSALGLPVVADETFAHTRLDTDREGLASVLAAGTPECLALTIGALDGVGLSEARLAWIAVSGPDDAALDALERLDELASALDAVSAPIAHALPALLEAAPQREIAARCARNLAALRARGLDVASVDGGWWACVRMPRDRSDDAWVDALRDEGLRVLPGSRFGLEADEAWVVVGLLVPEAELDAGLDVLAQAALRAR